MPVSTDATPTTVLAACARTLAGRPDLSLTASLSTVRGHADAIACRARFALPPTAGAQRPAGWAGKCFDALADARAEVLGTRWLPGVAGNLLRRPGVGTDAAEALRHDCFLALMSCADAQPAWIERLAGLRRVLEQPHDYARQACDLSLALAAAGGDHGVFAPGRAAPAPPDERAGEARADADNGPEEHADGLPQPSAASHEDSVPGVAPPALPASLGEGYRAFSTRYDRVVQPHELASPAELDRLRAVLDGELLPYRRLLARLAHQLQRLLLARQQRHWSLDQEEGQLDPSRLARLVADARSARIFRIEDEAPFRQTAVTLLLDNSGSMRGHAITVAALTADLLTRALERCGIRVEVLGFTTAHWQDGPVERDWRQAGSPAQPGRLNAVRHILYKAMDTPWRRARRGLGLMLQDGLLKENIDGEALWWASQRLMLRPEARRLLIVVSDGAPMDKATLTANPRNYLERHLHQVVAWVEKNTDIELRALGIGHPVGRHYRHAVNVRHVDELGSVLLAQLGEWLR